MAYASRHRRSERSLSCEQLETRRYLSGVSFAPHVIASKPDGRLSNSPLSIYLADFDRDGDMDVLSASLDDNRIVWYEKMDGGSTFGDPQLITMEAYGALSVYAADLDGDGDTDALTASIDDRHIAWYENVDGEGTFGDQQLIYSELDGANSVYAADFDGDGDLDVVSAALSWDFDVETFHGKIAWYENIDGEATFGDQQVISLEAFESSWVYAADLDGDDDMDVLSTSWANDRIVWYENTNGEGTFDQQHVINTEGTSTNSIHAADLDGDGDIDIITALSGSIVWYENTDGRGSFELQQIITDVKGFGGSGSVYAADFDGDGDMDVLTALRPSIVWYENTDGKGSFGSQQVVTDAIGGAPVYAADLDGDGDVDVLSRAGRNIVWYEQIELAPGDANRDLQFDQTDIVQVLQAATYLTGEPATFEQGDWNDDGVFDQLDIIVALQTGSYLHEATDKLMAEIG